MNTFTERLLIWHDESGRKNLPWQQEITPYRIWISEIMLQQTQVVTVIPYFESFITHFPTVEKLAAADLDKVLHLWSGLGYYARARNLHKAAEIICKKFNKQFPDNIVDLMALPGVGRSTAGAILAIAFQKKVPILDGNVKRVLSRYHAIQGHPGNKKVEDQLWKLAEKHTPRKQCAAYTQAIMDLGATICTRSNPSCQKCPVNNACIAYRENRTAEFPMAKQKTSIPVRHTCFIILKNQEDRIFLQRRPLVGIWGGLWSFPECEEENIAAYCQNHHFKIVSQERWNVIRHTFSHFHLDITPILLIVTTTKMQLNENDACWCPLSHLPTVGLAAPVKKILESIIL